MFCTSHFYIMTQYKPTKCTFSKLVVLFLTLMSSTCFEPEGSSSGRRLYLQLGLHLKFIDMNTSGPGGSVGIATDYGQDSPGSNPVGDEIFRPSRPGLGLTQPPVKWVLGLSRG